MKTFLLFLLVFHLCESSVYNLTLWFHNYSNPNSLDSDGSCCDQGGFLNLRCFAPCEPLFTICLKHSNASTNCPSTEHMIISGLSEGDALTFNDTIGGNLSNPIKFDNVFLRGSSAQIYVDIQDTDNGALSDHIDEVFVQVPLSSGTASAVQQYSGIHGAVTMELSYRVACGLSHYGMDCSVFCEPRNDTTGHYTCNKITGAIECLPGFTDVSSNCTTTNNDFSSSSSLLLGIATTNVLRVTNSFSNVEMTSNGLASSVSMILPDPEGSGGAVIGGTIAAILVVLLIGLVSTTLIIFVVLRIRKHKSSSLPNANYYSTAKDPTVKGPKSLDNPLYGGEPMAEKEDNMKDHMYECCDQSVMSSGNYEDMESGTANRPSSSQYGTLYETPHDAAKPKEEIAGLELSINLNNDLYCSMNGVPQDSSAKDLDDKARKSYVLKNAVYGNSNSMSNHLRVSDYEEPVPISPVDNLYTSMNYSEMSSSSAAEETYEVPVNASNNYEKPWKRKF